ncbi:hypothetical protein [Flavobacterium sp. GSB-24]|uniref:hypothetical protein n=1 Tax=Flavobacterium sp. GSB-24 TaxID=2994319 RepID=UPI002491EBD8|nr:hypothetical protein [Flavobacterium sp. GSB-24]BDU27711.1 hypothetical protein FLGSB24_44550 [Flavobacterium sp. GSB-24]
MIYEKIKKEFIIEVEELISKMRAEIQSLSGLEQVTVKIFHLDNFKQFTKRLNIKINRIVDENKLVFKNQKEGDEFSAFMKPTFEKFYKEYTDISKE